MTLGSLAVLTLCAALPSAAAGTSPDGLVAHGTFAEGSGKILHDTSGNGPNGVRWWRNEGHK